jgi:hypothetical protein
MSLIQKHTLNAQDWLLQAVPEECACVRVKTVERGG